MCKVNDLRKYKGIWRVVGEKAHTTERSMPILALSEEQAMQILVKCLEMETGYSYDPIQMVVKTEEGYFTNIRVIPLDDSESFQQGVEKHC